MKKILRRTLKLLALVYLLICLTLYFFQEKIIFAPEKLDKNFTFTFTGKFEELNIKTEDQKILNGVLFKADGSKGLIFYLHGNAGSLNSWGGVSKIYTELGYDVYMLDYRGYGKSEGAITSQRQLLKDIQAAYNEMKTRYSENKIIVLGYSLGTALAAKVASTNNPRLLILQAPYYNLTGMMHQTYPVIPTFLLKYRLQTNVFIQDCKMPIVIFHGNEDEVIPYESSLKLKSLFKPGDTLITLKNQGHNGITDNPEYQKEIKNILK